MKKEYKTKKCPVCGANIEITEFDDGTILVRRDCICNLSEQKGIDENEPREATEA
jgi:hypothetical protein